MRAALIQLCAGPDPERNLAQTLDLIGQAQGAELIVTPECSNMICADRAELSARAAPEAEDLTLRALQEAARGRWLLIGSLALKSGALKSGERFVNRSFLISPEGEIAARYDKIHMFDVTISATESYRESASYQAGDRAVLAQGPAALGMMICYDLRFPLLARRLAQAGAEVLTYPAAFNDTTGAAHWHTLLRARAIETGSFVLAPAQCGQHHPARRSYGHSLAVDPWGRVLAEAGDAPCCTLVDLDLALVAQTRARIPSLTETPFEVPHG